MDHTEIKFLFSLRNLLRTLLAKELNTDQAFLLSSHFSVSEPRYLSNVNELL